MGDFYGLPTRIISNEHLRLEFLAQAGPRIVRLMLNGSDENQLVELPELKWATPYGDYFVRGGHRLWYAPEAFPRSYIPDNDGLTVEEVDGAVRLWQSVEAPTGIRKSLEIRLLDNQPGVTLCHRLQNEGTEPIRLSAWAITQMRLGGIVMLPQQVEPVDSDGLLPNRHLVLWPYTRWQDARLRLHDDYVLIEALPQAPAFKVGTLNLQGWIGYLRQGVLFLKRFQPHPDRPHADLCCNVEVYCNEYFIELETLGPLSRLEPGQSVTHIETWELYKSLGVPQTPDGVRDLVCSLHL